MSDVWKSIKKNLLNESACVSEIGTQKYDNYVLHSLFSE